mgnify:CR=1 FL=1
MKGIFPSLLKGSLIALIFASSFAIAKEEVWLDVRTKGEYNSGHVAGATHIPHGEIGDRISDLIGDKNTLIHVYCRSGNRAGIALKVMEEMGYINAHNDGGFSALKHEPVAK